MSVENQAEIATVFPVALMPAGRKGVVVGAGKAGSRKALALLDAGARVTVVAPEAHPDVRQKADAGALTWMPRPFQPDDADGALVVFAATDNVALNQDILAACRARGVLCGIVDHGWRHGDFISPAILKRDDGLTVAVSTGGRSCRRSRMIRDSIGRHIQAVEGAVPVVIGTSHACLALDKRESLALTGARLDSAAGMLRQIRGVHEFVLLNTCNRIECHAVMSPEPETEQLVRRILGFESLAPGESYALRGFDAFHHTALLLAGLRSQTAGESPIVAQAKTAYADAGRAGWSGGMMDEWLASSLHIAKAIRSASPARPTELEERVLDHLAAAVPGALEQGLTLIGTGTLGRAVLDTFLARHPAGRATWIFHRQKPALPPSDNGRIDVRCLDELDRLLPRAHAIVCAVASPEPVLSLRHAALFPPGQAVPIVDLGMPRNVDPALAGAGIRLTDLDALKRLDRQDPAILAGRIEAGSRLAAEHRDLYDKLMRGLRQPD
jgi:precorrin-2 dehydrogenase/sirohydrochlorin ferrochelatase